MKKSTQNRSVKAGTVKSTPQPPVKSGSLVRDRNKSSAASLVREVSKEEQLAHPEIWGPTTTIPLPLELSEVPDEELEDMKESLVVWAEIFIGGKVDVDQLSFGTMYSTGEAPTRTLVIRHK